MLALGQLGIGKLHKYDETGRAFVHFGGEGTKILAPRTPIARVRLSAATPVIFRTQAGQTLHGEVLEFLLEREDGGFVYRIASGEAVYDIWEGHIMPSGDSPFELAGINFELLTAARAQQLLQKNSIAAPSGSAATRCAPRRRHPRRGACIIRGADEFLLSLVPRPS